MSSFSDNFFSLPLEMKKEISFHLSPSSLLVVQNVFLGKPFPFDFSEELQKDIICSGSSLLSYFWKKIDKKKVCDWAAEMGRHESLQYAIENGGFCTRETWKSAIDSSDLPCLLYLMTGTYPLAPFRTTEICRYAAQKKSLSSLKVFYQACFHWDKLTPIAAMENKDLECLSFVLEHGAPFDSKICALAHWMKWKEGIDYIHHRGYPLGPDGFCYLQKICYHFLSFCPRIFIY